MEKPAGTIQLNHGTGGKLMHELIDKLFLGYLGKVAENKGDSAVLNIPAAQLAFTTDSYVVDPIFFPGGNIGKLAVCGTVNDLAVTGAKPFWLSAGFIIEEGFPMKELDVIVKSMAEEAKAAGVTIVTGDTKVVEKGKADKLFINTAGIGEVKKESTDIASGKRIKTGDAIIISGTIGDHSIAVLGARQSYGFSTKLHSDCASLNGLIARVLIQEDIHFMRDATRGGLATVLCEISREQNMGIEIQENDIPVKEEVHGICELLGFDPLYLANEGKVVMVVDKDVAPVVVKELKKHPLGKDSSIIGEITEEHQGDVLLNTAIGGRRLIKMLSGEQLPRIC